MKFAVRIRYLESGDNKTHQHTTKWYDEIDDAWEEANKFQYKHSSIIEASSSLIHKEN